MTSRQVSHSNRLVSHVRTEISANFKMRKRGHGIDQVTTSQSRTYCHSSSSTDTAMELSLYRKNHHKKRAKGRKESPCSSDTSGDEAATRRKESSRSKKASVAKKCTVSPSRLDLKEQTKPMEKDRVVNAAIPKNHATTEYKRDPRRDIKPNKFIGVDLPDLIPDMC